MQELRFFNKWLEPFPDRWLCFWLGFLPAGITVALSGAIHGLYFGYISIIPAIKALLVYGGIAGMFSLILAYFMRNFRAHSKNRWVWLSFAMPMFGCQLAALMVSLVNIIQHGKVVLNQQITEAAINLGIYGLAALVFGFISIFIISLHKCISFGPKMNQDTLV